jgi:hypothetical protein
LNKGAGHAEGLVGVVSGAGDLDRRGMGGGQERQDDHLSDEHGVLLLLQVLPEVTPRTREWMGATAPRFSKS